MSLVVLIVYIFDSVQSLPKKSHTLLFHLPYFPIYFLLFFLLFINSWSVPHMMLNTDFNYSECMYEDSEMQMTV